MRTIQTPEEVVETALRALDAEEEPQSISGWTNWFDGRSRTLRAAFVGDESGRQSFAFAL